MAKQEEKKPTAAEILAGWNSNNVTFNLDDLFSRPSYLARQLQEVRFDIIGAKVEHVLDGENVELIIDVKEQKKDGDAVVVEPGEATTRVAMDERFLKVVAFFGANPTGRVQNATLKKQGRDFYLAQAKVPESEKEPEQTQTETEAPAPPAEPKTQTAAPGKKK